MNHPHYLCRRNMRCPGTSPASATSDPNLKALLARLVDTLEVARVTVDDLARDLTSDRWQGLPPPRSR